MLSTVKSSGGKTNSICRVPCSPYLQPCNPYLQPSSPYLQPSSPYLEQPCSPYLQPCSPFLEQPCNPYMEQPYSPYPALQPLPASLTTSRCTACCLGACLRNTFLAHPGCRCCRPARGGGGT
jgi:hypothetical protein